MEWTPCPAPGLPAPSGRSLAVLSSPESLYLTGPSPRPREWPSPPHHHGPSHRPPASPTAPLTGPRNEGPGWTPMLSVQQGRGLPRWGQCSTEPRLGWQGSVHGATGPAGVPQGSGPRAKDRGSKGALRDTWGINSRTQKLLACPGSSWTRPSFTGHLQGVSYHRTNGTTHFFTQDPWCPAQGAAKASTENSPLVAKSGWGTSE